MSAARAAGMASGWPSPKTQGPKTRYGSSAPITLSGPGPGQHPPARAPLSRAALRMLARVSPAGGPPSAASSGTTTAQEPSPAAGAPQRVPPWRHLMLGLLMFAAAKCQASPAATPAGAPPRLWKLDQNGPLAAVQGNWRAILNRMSVPGAAEQLMKVHPARMDRLQTLAVSADIATLRAVKGFVPELTARVSEFLRRQVTIHAQGGEAR